MPVQTIIPTPTDPAAPKEKVEVRGHVKSGKMKGRKVTVLLDADELMKEQVGGFVNFVREHAIVGLAIGFIIGQQAQGVIKQLVDSFITPVLELLLGGSLKNKVFTVAGVNFTWGLMLYSLMNLIFVLATIYILVKFLNLDKLDKPQAPADKPAETPTDKPAKTPTPAKV